MYWFPSMFWCMISLILNILICLWNMILVRYFRFLLMSYFNQEQMCFVVIYSNWYSGMCCTLVSYFSIFHMVAVSDREQSRIACPTSYLKLFWFLLLLIEVGLTEDVLHQSLFVTCTGDVLYYIKEVLFFTSFWNYLGFLSHLVSLWFIVLPILSFYFLFFHCSYGGCFRLNSHHN